MLLSLKKKKNRKREKKADLGEKNPTWARKLKWAPWLSSVKKIARWITLIVGSYQPWLEKPLVQPRPEMPPPLTGRAQKSVVVRAAQGMSPEEAPCSGCRSGSCFCPRNRQLQAPCFPAEADPQDLSLSLLSDHFRFP